MSDDPFMDLLKAVCGPLDETATSYAITGSVASSIHGEPLVSQDVDICLTMVEAQARRIAQTLPSRFYRSEEALCEAARTYGMANLIDSATGLKVDLSFLPPEPFYVSVLARRRKIEFSRGGSDFWVVSPEDVIVMKLLWRKESRSVKQWENALSVVRTQGARLEWPYLWHWADVLGLKNDLTELAREGAV